MVNHYLLSQYVKKKGIKLFGECGMRAARKELEKIHYRKLIKPRLPIDLSSEQKRICLPYLMFIKERKYGPLKER